MNTNTKQCRWKCFSSTPLDAKLGHHCTMHMEGAGAKQRKGNWFHPQTHRQGAAQNQDMKHKGEQERGHSTRMRRGIISVNKTFSLPLVLNWKLGHFTNYSLDGVLNRGQSSEENSLPLILIAWTLQEGFIGNLDRLIPSSTVESSWVTLTASRSTRSCRWLMRKQKLFASLNSSPKMSSAWRPEKGPAALRTRQRKKLTCLQYLTDSTKNQENERNYESKKKRLGY